MTVKEDDARSINYTCPACASKPGEKCSRPTSEGFKYVNWFHYSRTALVRDMEESPRFC